MNQESLMRQGSICSAVRHNTCSICYAARHNVWERRLGSETRFLLFEVDDSTISAGIRLCIVEAQRSE